MPTTRKKVNKTIYKDENSEEECEHFSDSGSEAKISDVESSTDEEAEYHVSSGDEFINTKRKHIKTKHGKKKKPTPSLYSKLKSQISANENEKIDVSHSIFSIKDLTDADKLLPSVLNLSESGNEDESPKAKKHVPTSVTEKDHHVDSDNETNIEYKDVWAKNLQDDSEEIAKRKFLELEQHKTKFEETKSSIKKYSAKLEEEKSGINVKDLLALGEEVVSPTRLIKQKAKSKKARQDSDSDIDEWEEVKENKAIPQQGLELIVDFPGAVCRKTKTIDIEMMMKRKMNRVKKEYQIYMHKVHVLCWLGHGNYVSRVINDQEIMAAALKMVPAKECYPGERVDMKYIEQITIWYKDKLILKQDKNEDKFRPKAPPLKEILLGQIKSRIATTKKYIVFIFVSMLRALGLQCRVMFNFVTLPIRPPSSELCSLSIKKKNKSTIEKPDQLNKSSNTKDKVKTSSKVKANSKILQVDGIDDINISSDDIDSENIFQLDGSNDTLSVQTRKTRSTKAKNMVNEHDISKEDVSPPKRSKKSPNLNSTKVSKTKENVQQHAISVQEKDKIEPNKSNISKVTPKKSKDYLPQNNDNQVTNKKSSNYLSRKSGKTDTKNSLDKKNSLPEKNITETKPPEIVITHETENVSSEYFDNKDLNNSDNLRLSRKRSRTTNPTLSQKSVKPEDPKNVIKIKSRTKSAPIKTETSKYFSDSDDKNQIKKPKIKLGLKSNKSKIDVMEDKKRVSHRDLTKPKTNSKSDITGDLVKIVKNRIKEAKEDTKQHIVKGKNKKDSDEDSDFLPEEIVKSRESESDNDFKPSKISPKPSTSRKPSTGRKIDRRVVSTDDEAPQKKIDVWCEVFVEELEQWVCVDVITGKIHCADYIYGRATHPVCYVVGWDNNNYLKDVTRRYVPHWNTVTRKQRVEPGWWNKAIEPWLGPKTAKDREEDQYLDRMQLEAPLPKSIAEYKNHPLYALKRHLLKFEAIYPPDAATLGFVRQEAVYARECVYVCRSRDTWLKEAKVVRLGENPYKIVKARPKWDKLSNKLITDKPLELFGPWQVQDYEPPVAENGIVPRNAYGNVELFKDCMLPKGTVHIKLPGLNKVARKLNIDCAPAMTGFDFNGGWSHPVFDGFVVCKEFEEIVTDAWIKDQEEQQRKEIEKTEARVYGNWKRLIKGLLIRERLKYKYGFQEPSTSAMQSSKKGKGPRFVVKKKT
ncbi:DNA repair protein complementing XP-C cells homolog isoform X2 [Galleria mellonella]|uniref:DNA repair protein complementing XP-C cells homolog isoform X2 n=1 Tax=Galleria mellonella TaxID=7137 RepID=A0ABM3MJZ9_GALME|nr:DNA repair protein complementing XP-C cells homolog isoform X2 [Galleria mellonella]